MFSLPDRRCLTSRLVHTVNQALQVNENLIMSNMSSRAKMLLQGSSCSSDHLELEASELLLKDILPKWLMVDRTIIVECACLDLFSLIEFGWLCRLFMVHLANIIF